MKKQQSKKAANNGAIVIPRNVHAQLLKLQGPSEEFRRIYPQWATDAVAAAIAKGAEMVKKQLKGFSLSVRCAAKEANQLCPHIKKAGWQR
ncbi:MAG: hypothetical protein KAW12_13815 [Candidatus Aminicenantes bacterium]|nr:hypothetical protein [Candidatus Aminicenantes bacterium]